MVEYSVHEGCDSSESEDNGEKRRGRKIASPSRGKRQASPEHNLELTPAMEQLIMLTVEKRVADTVEKRVTEALERTHGKVTDERG